MVSEYAVGSNDGNPRLKDPRTRILVSRDEQSKNLERIRRAERYKLVQLERSIKAKDDLAERIKTERDGTTRSIISSRKRWEKKKAAIRLKPGTWASLSASSRYTDAPSTTSTLGYIDDFTTSAFNERGAGSDNRNEVLQISSRQPTSLPLSLKQDHSSSRPSEETVGLINYEGPSDEKENHMPPTTPRSSTLVAHALWGGITDAETGETLELRQRKWEFPVQKRGEATLPPCSGRDDNHRRQTSGDIKSDARQDQSYGGEGEENLFSEFNRFHRDSSLVPDQEESTRNAPIYSEAVSVEAKRDFGGYSGTPKSMKLPFEGRGTSQAFRSLNASSGLCLLNGQGEDGILPTFEEREHEPQTPPSTEPMHSPFWMPTPQKPPFLGTSRELRALAGAQSPGKKAGEERDLREHGLPPSQQLGSCELPQTTIDGGIEDRSLTLADIGSVTARRSGSMGFTANGSDCAMTTKALSRDTQRKMVLIQNIRDRYLRQVRDMVVEENREEKVRITALRRVLRHPLRYRYVQKRFNRERKDKQTLINWIRKDIELIVVQKMAALGLVR